MKYFGNWEAPDTPAAMPPSDEAVHEPVEGLRPRGQLSRLEQASPAGPAVMQAYYRPGLASKDALALDVIGWAPMLACPCPLYCADWRLWCCIMVLPLSSA